MHRGRPRNPGATKLGTKLSYPKTLIKNASRAMTLAIMARFWPKSCHFCLFLSLFRHFFGCHGHKYAYFTHRSNMHLPWTYTKLVSSSFGHCHASVMNTGASKMVDLGVKNRSQWQWVGLGQGFIMETPAIPPPCARGGQKWQFLGSKSGHNGRVTQGTWNHRGNSLTPQITSILIG